MSNYRAKSLEALYEWLAKVGTESTDDGGSTFSFTNYDIADLAFLAKTLCRHMKVIVFAAALAGAAFGWAFATI